MTQSPDETAIAALLEQQADAIRGKHAEAALLPFANNLVRYDLAPPLSTQGAQALDRGNLTAWFETWRGPIHYQLRDMSIETSGDMAFALGFVQIGGTKQSGETAHVWARQTICLRKRGGDWKIVHIHTSTPFYMDGSLKAAIDLTP